MARSRRKIPFLVLAPVLVALVGLLSALVIGTLGVHNLRLQSDEAAGLRARVLSVSLAERLRSTGSQERATVIERAARRSGAELLLATRDGAIEVDATLSAPSRATTLQMLIAGKGETTTALGRTRYYAEPLGPRLSHLSVISFVRAPERPFATGSLLTSIATLTLMLLGVATLVAFALARDVHADVTFVSKRIHEMADEGQPAGKPIPVRTVDQIGLLTDAFNMLVERFTAAEHAYRQDLAGAEAYDRDRSAFLAALSHELRTPLNAILGFTDVLLSEVDGPLSPGARESLDIVRASGGHLRALIDDILDLSALESGELRLSRNMVDVYAVAEDVVREARVTAELKHLDMHLGGEHGLAYADGRRVRQVIGNVVGNAVKFTSAGSVSVDVQVARGGIDITVADTGPGIAAHEQESIFEEYRQSGEPMAQRSGTGLGLAITRRLVQMHGGTIRLASRLGHGSTFVITLPTEPPPRLSSPRSEPPPSAPRASAPRQRPGTLS